MNKILISAGALAVAFVTTPAIAAAANTATANASVNIVSPLTLQKDADLNFGTIVGPFTGQIVHVNASGLSDCATVGLTCSGTPASAKFTVTGTKGQPVVLTIPNSVVLNNTGPGGGSLNVDLSGDKPVNPTLDGTTGKASFAIGGKLTLASGATDGLYTSTFDVTANYQ